MASDITNKASVLSYQYLCGDREQDGDLRYHTVVNAYTQPSIALEKVCTVEGFPGTTAVDLGEVITLTYTVLNTATAPITYTTAIIEDPILTNPSIQIIAGSEVGGDHVGDVIHVDIPDGLQSGQSAVYWIKIKVIAPDAPVNLLQKNAVATLTTADGISNQTVDACNLAYHHGEIAVDKTNDPSSVVTAGQEITYTVTIENTSETTCTIDVQQFADPIPKYTNFVRIDTNGSDAFMYVDTPVPTIYNKNLITLDPDTNIELVFTVVTVKQ